MTKDGEQWYLNRQKTRFLIIWDWTEGQDRMDNSLSILKFEPVIQLLCNLIQSLKGGNQIKQLLRSCWHIGLQTPAKWDRLLVSHWCVMSSTISESWGIWAPSVIVRYECRAILDSSTTPCLRLFTCLPTRTVHIFYRRLYSYIHTNFVKILRVLQIVIKSGTNNEQQTLIIHNSVPTDAL